MKINQALLALFAHPDDEAFTCGGVLAQYAAAGAQVALVCATRGEAGQISDPSLATPETLGQVREAELRCACEQLGINDLTFLGYRDSGMAGTPDNGDPRAYANAPAEEVVPHLVGIIRRRRPRGIITFDPNGGYGHPDHLAIHRHTVEAFHAAADPTRYPEQGPAWQTDRLFYTVLVHSFFEEMRQRLVALGADTSRFDEWRERGIGWPDEQVDVTCDVGDQIEAKRRAFRCHRTQINPESPFQRIPEAEMKQMIRQERFVLAWPKPEPGVHLTDLFADLEMS